LVHPPADFTNFFFYVIWLDPSFRLHYLFRCLDKNLARGGSNCHFDPKYRIFC
jgi:hypothetical protein